jgi:hypothetical protein
MGDKALCFVEKAQDIPNAKKVYNDLKTRFSRVEA